ncbi:MAG: hypothetical protein FD123_2059 [Bacteroidetes bacterium]|nr:MAG: hypothetical protein FD123_2059 [Bacteroidota bacterium]
MSILTGVSHISFDLWLTLIRSAPGFKPERDRLLAGHFGIQRSPEKISETVRHFDRLFDRVSMITGKSIDADEIVLVILDALGADISAVSREQLQRFYVDMEDLFFSSPPVLIDPQMPHHLEKLREKGFTLSLLSNTAFIRGKTLRKILAHYEMDIHFDFQLYSDEIGYAKPAPGAFACLWQEAKKRRSLEKEMILHIGDNPDADVKGASDFGMRAALFNRQETALADMLEC